MTTSTTEREKFIEKCYRLGIQGTSNHSLNELWSWIENLLAKREEDMVERVKEEVVMTTTVDGKRRENVYYQGFRDAKQNIIQKLIHLKNTNLEKEETK